MYRGDVLRDPGRYRLRTPPPGYDWVGVGGDIYLMQRGSGMVLDAIPGGY
jgi:Ni/Co efflux regulator RcnB